MKASLAKVTNVHQFLNEINILPTSENTQSHAYTHVIER